MARILVIDDDDQLRATMCEMLVQAGHEVSEAANGAEGLAAFRRSPTDLVVTDIFMPETDGFEVILILHRDVPNLPILAVSGGTTRLRLGEQYISSILRTAQRFGASRALSKPFERQEFLSAVETLLTSGPEQQRPTYAGQKQRAVESTAGPVEGALSRRSTIDSGWQHEGSRPRGSDEPGHSRDAASGHAPRSPADSASEPDESQGSDAVEDKALKLKGCSRAAVEGIPSTTDRPAGPDILARLTSKERQVVEALSAGTTVPRIARTSGRSPRTVRNQLRSVYRKLGIHSQVELLSRLRHN